MLLKRLVGIHLLLALGICALPAIAKDTPEPRPKQSDDNATTQPAVLPEVSLHGVALTDALDLLRDLDHSFQPVIAYAPGASPDTPPVIRQLMLKNVTVQDVLTVLQQVFPFVSFETVQLNRHDVTIVRISPDPNDQPRGGGGGLLGGGGGEDRAVTTVYPLRSIVDNICRDSLPRFHPADEEKQFAAALVEKRKQARDGVLSLVETAIQTEGSKGDVTLKVHEPTETLVFKGTPRQTALVTQALESLTPQQGEPAPAAEVKALREEVRQLRGRMAEIAGFYGQPPLPPPTTRPAVPNAAASSDPASKQK